MDERLGFIHDKMGCVLAFKDSAAIDIANLKSHCETTKNDPARISSLEKWRWGLTGAFAFMVLLMGWGWIVIGGAK
ncbi:MAG: hypothetical protein WC455_21225 [Dehalococcoidia bacterium]|jgi:hypothetical protein